MTLLFTDLPLLCLVYLQRKSNRAKEKKQRRLEERAAMDAVCAKVDAANKVKYFPQFSEVDEYRERYLELEFCFVVIPISTSFDLTARRSPVCFSGVQKV